MKIFGLIGYPLHHSFSQRYFTDKFKKEEILNCVYHNFEIDSIEKFPQLFKTQPDIHGLNCTIPYKEQVMKYLDEIDEEANQVGAVNTIKVIRDGVTKLKGFNTDIFGFETSLKPFVKPIHKKALILGTGGASKAIKYILKKWNIDFISASIEELKENEIRYEQINESIIKEHLLIINATPLGTFPDIDKCPPIPYQHITSNHVLFDLVYNPEETKFLKQGKEKGAAIKNGLEMLYLQAEKAWSIWNM